MTSAVLVLRHWNRILMRALATPIMATLALMCGSPAAAATRGPVVLAAASLRESLKEAAQLWVRQGHDKPILTFAGSQALARQVEAGAPADLFISADEEWMDHVAARGQIRAASRADFLSNSLVLIAPVRTPKPITIGPRFGLAAALGSGRLAMADPRSVPAGKYGKAALVRLGVWASVADRVAPSDNVRGALALVERGEVPLGIVYATDARQSSKVRVVGTFPATSHPPIRYPLALLRSSRHPEAAAFRRFLLSPAGLAVFRRYGFRSR